MDLLSFAAETGSVAEWTDPPAPKRCARNRARVEIGRRLRKSGLLIDK